MIIKEFFITDAKESPGRVYKAQPGTESVFYTRKKGNIYSMAFSNSGSFYFVNANENNIYRVFKIKILWWTWTFTVKIYTHSTYIRDILLDKDGNIYFSEASGAGANGKIYKINSGPSTATLFQEIELSEVGGFWAGNFIFDTQGNLYISSGNRIPASIYRLRDGIWEEIFTDSSAPIKGLTFLACDLLCYANWRSEIYTLDIQSGTRELIYSNPIHQWVSDIALFRPKIIEDTLYEGPKDYSCASTCWRDDGTAVDTWDFTDINADNANIQAMLNDIGVPTAPTNDDNEIWNRTKAVWAWLQEHALGIEDANFDAVCAYRDSLDGWPTIAEFAHMFVNWGGFGWKPYVNEEGGTVYVCTCMCRAHLLATLLYRVGVPLDRMAIAETKWKPEYSQHMYVVLKLGCHWYYIDPSYDIPELSDTPENLGAGARDYKHPNELDIIPGSTIIKPMLVR